MDCQQVTTSTVTTVTATTATAATTTTSICHRPDCAGIGPCCSFLQDGILDCQAVGDDGQCAAGSTNCPPGRARRGVNLSPTCQVLPEKTVVSGTRGEKTIGLDDVNSSDSSTRTCQVDTYCPNEYKQGYCSISSAAI